MSLTYSITLGIAFGFLSFVLIKLFIGSIQEIKTGHVGLAGHHALIPLFYDDFKAFNAIPGHIIDTEIISFWHMISDGFNFSVEP